MKVGGVCGGCGETISVEGSISTLHPTLHTKILVYLCWYPLSRPLSQGGVISIPLSQGGVISIPLSQGGVILIPPVSG